MALLERQRGREGGVGRFAVGSETQSASASGAWSRAKMLARQRAMAAAEERLKAVDRHGRREESRKERSEAGELRTQRSAKVRLAEQRADGVGGRTILGRAC